MENTIRRSHVGPLRMARVTQGIRQRELEAAAGIPAKTLNHFETRRRQPNAKYRASLAEALEMPEDELFPGGTCLG